MPQAAGTPTSAVALNDVTVAFRVARGGIFTAVERASLTVAETDGRTISKLTLRKQPEPAPEEEDQTEPSPEGAD